jgi:hypothetical protein
MIRETMKRSATLLKVRASSWETTITLLIALHIFFTTWFYLTLPHSSRSTGYLSWLWVMLFGIAIGLHGRKTLLRDTLVFCLVITFIAVAVHCFAKALGIYVDMATFYAWPLMILLFFANLFFCLIGSAIGWSLRRIFIHRFFISERVCTTNDKDQGD